MRTSQQQHILIIEDDVSIQETLKLFLEHEGYRVSAASHGQEGLDLLLSQTSSDRPELILLDLMMPVMSGEEFLKARANHPELTPIPVITMSAAFNARESERTGYASLSKPITIDDLTRAIQVALKPGSSNTTSEE